MTLELVSRFQPESAGVALVSLSTNGSTAAQVEFSKAPNAHPVYSAIGLVKGQEVLTGESDSLTTSFQNYLRDDGVRPGRNAVEVKLELVEWSGPAPDVAISPSGGFSTTGVSPYPLVLEVPTSASRERKDRFTVPYRLTVTNGRVVDDVVVVARPDPGLVVVGKSEHTIGRVKKARSGSFVVRRDSPDSAVLHLGVVSSANRPSADIRVGGSESAGGGAQIAIGFLVVIAGAGLLVRRRHSLR